MGITTKTRSSPGAPAKWTLDFVVLHIHDNVEKKVVESVLAEVEVNGLCKPMDWGGGGFGGGSICPREIRNEENTCSWPTGWYKSGYSYAWYSSTGRAGPDDTNED